LLNQGSAPLRRRIHLFGLLGQSRPDAGGVVPMHLLEVPQLPLDKEAAGSLKLDLVRDNRMPGRGRSA
jgi:hypothetical protein